MKRLPPHLVISDMNDVLHTAWYCGAKLSEGVYGRISWGNFNAYQRVHVFKLPAVNKLTNFTIATQMIDPLQERMFAIGETYSASNTQSYIMELDVDGTGINGFEPYTYAKMHFQEKIDDVELVDNRVVFVSRDYRSDSSKVNLRISGVEQMLAGSEIDKQWRFQLKRYETVFGRVFITNFLDGNFGVCYVKYNSMSSKYFLCVHRINMHDFLLGTNSILSQEMEVSARGNIQDIIFDKYEKVLIILFDESNTRSIFIHGNPYYSSAYGAICLESTDGERYFSLDTLLSYYLTDCRRYEAWGGNRCFIQGFYSGGSIVESCLHPTIRNVRIGDRIEIVMKIDTIERLTGIRDYEYEELPWPNAQGTRDCFEVEREGSDEIQ